MAIMTKAAAEDKLGGLSLMMLFTAMWTAIAAVFLQGADYFVSTIIAATVLIFFIFQYIRLQTRTRALPGAAEAKEADAKKNKWFLVIFGAEGVAILLAQIILSNTNHGQLFIAFFALIVGLHFFPLAKVFNRKFDYYMGAWTTAVALTGLLLLLYSKLSPAIASAAICMGCAIATGSYAGMMIHQLRTAVGLQKRE